MAEYSTALETSLAKVIENMKGVFDICNKSRADFEATLPVGTHWRDYHYDVIKVFEAISNLERAALLVIDNVDTIRKQNDALLNQDDGGNTCACTCCST